MCAPRVNHDGDYSAPNCGDDEDFRGEEIIDQDFIYAADSGGTN